MSKGISEKKDISQQDAKFESGNVLHSEALVNTELMSDAVDGENREHEMGVWEAIRGHPWACFWAFIMCFTIVSVVNSWFLPSQSKVMRS